MDLENLVFEGGGVKGIAYAGAIKAFKDKGLLKNVKRVAGTSAGSIVAGLLALGYDPDEIKTVVSNTNFADFEDKKKYLRILSTYGLYKGDAFLAWMRDKVKRKMDSQDATFEDLQNKGLPELRVFATDLNHKDVQEFSFRQTPKVRVAEAIRASMSIPIFFAAWQFPDGVPTDHIYVDGGTVFNYPITTFDDGSPNQKTVGLRLDNLEDHPVHKELKPKQIRQYVKDLFDTLLRSQNIAFANDPEMVARSIIIDDYGISATDFKLDKEKQKKLFDSGYEYTAKFLEA